MIATSIKKAFLLLLLLLITTPGFAVAHQPRIVESQHTVVVDPEISKAYYGQLAGAPDVYTIQANTPFDLYVNILVPDISGQKKDVTATIEKDGRPLATLDGTQFNWTQMFEPFGYDSYWTGPEYKAKVSPGIYRISVTSSNLDSKYSLAIGEAENFDFTEIMNALTLIPQLKSNFFNESPLSFILSPFGWGLILTLYVLSGIVGLIYRFTLQKISRRPARVRPQNIGKLDRLARLAIGIALLMLAITTTWNPIMIFFSGFAIFEAIFSWCGLYAVMGKNTCPT